MLHNHQYLSCRDIYYLNSISLTNYCSQFLGILALKLKKVEVEGKWYVRFCRNSQQMGTWLWHCELYLQKYLTYRDVLNLKKISKRNCLTLFYVSWLSDWNCVLWDAMRAANSISFKSQPFGWVQNFQIQILSQNQKWPF